MARTNQICCPNCNEKLEKCADKEKCPRWRTSYDVCIIFGTRPFRTGFCGASIFR
jgi:hypothetical protein